MKKVLGIGNALMDILIKTPDEEIIDALNYPKGSMQLISTQELNKMVSITAGMKKCAVAGGSAANSMVGLARLGANVGLIGKIGKDETGGHFKDSLINNGVEPHLFLNETPSGRCHVLISPDSERTMFTYLGAASELVAGDIKVEIVEQYDLVHVEGYLVQNYELMERIGEVVKECGVKLSIDLASFNVVEENLEFLNNFVDKYVDIVFANEEEAKVFTGDEAEMALDNIASRVEIAVVKVGSRGSFVKCGEKKCFIPAQKIECVDTTGAGDLYAAGFLYGVINDMSLEKCAEIATASAAEVIQVLGAKIPDEAWMRINNVIV